MAADSSQTASEPSSQEASGQSSKATSTGSIVEIDGIVNAWSERRQEIAEGNAAMAAEREEFLQRFEQISISLIQPTMQSVADRLERDGGGGLVELHPGSGTRGPRVTLWMALDGPISGEPREDRNPYLRLDADTPHRTVAVWEGDMWDNKGGSGPSAPLTLSDISADSITKSALEILRRAASHNDSLSSPE
jgi:hypothetical protein